MVGIALKFATSLSCLLLSMSVHAFGATGHRMVGDLASDRLTPKARAGIAALLSDDRLASGAPSGRSTLGEVANWADEIRAFPAIDKPKWHYVNVPVCGPTAGQVHCPGGECLARRLPRLLKVVADKKAPTRTRNEALKWVVHLVGDMHQPLHTTNNGDSGGNAVLVSLLGVRQDEDGKPLNLHSVWDTQFSEKAIELAGGYPVFAAQPIPDALQQAWVAGTVTDWLTESRQIALARIYERLPAGFTCGSSPVGVVELGDAYINEAASLSATQLRKAGVRLARLLNDIFE